MSIISIKDLVKHEDDVLRKYPMLGLLRDIIEKYPNVTVKPCTHWYKTKDGLDVLSGYHINFGKYTLSVQFGFGNYTTGYPNQEIKPRNLTQDHYLKSAFTAEIAVINESMPDTPLVQIKEWGDCVLGYQSPEEIMMFIDSFLAPMLGSGE